MSKVVLDEGVPEQIAPLLEGHQVDTVRGLGLKGTLNGKLLQAIEDRGIDAFVSNDKKLEFDANVARRPFAVLLLSTNHWPTVQPNVERIVSALNTAESGKVTRVDVGQFLPRKLRRASPPRPLT